MSGARSLASAVGKGAKLTENNVRGYFLPLCTARHLSVRFYYWDVSRYIGDAMHIIALIFCLIAVLQEGGTDGVSLRTHLLFIVVFSARFLNVFFCEQPVYLVIYKVLLWSITLKIVALMFVRGSWRDKRDTMRLTLLMFPTAVITLVFGTYSAADEGLLAELLWMFSNCLEGLAMLPQYVYCYRDVGNDDGIVLCYVVFMGAYRTVFGLTWICNNIFFRDYLEFSSLVSGLLGIAFFADFVIFKVKGKSQLSSLCVYVDDSIQEAEQDLREALQNSEERIFEVELDNLLQRNDEGTIGPEVIGKSSSHETPAPRALQQSLQGIFAQAGDADGDLCVGRFARA